MVKKDILNTEEKLCIFLGFLSGIILWFIALPFYENNRIYEENVFAQNLFAKYRFYDDVKDDYIPSENVRIIIIEDCPSGKVVEVQRENVFSKKYFIKKDMNYYILQW